MFEKESIYILIDPKQPGFLKIGYGKSQQDPNTEDSITGYQAGMEVAFCKDVKMARHLFNKVSIKLQEDALGTNIKNDMFLISVVKCIKMINSIYEKYTEESTNLKFIPNQSTNLVKLCEERSRIKFWERIGEIPNYKIFISRQFESITTDFHTLWILMSHDVKKRTKPSTFKSKALGSEISKIKYFFKDEKYEYLYYSVFNKAMGTGDLVIEDIIFPRINMNATGKNSGYNKLVIDYLSSTQKSANAN